MRVLKRSARQAPKVSFVLLDWSVRESFHFLHYLANQSIDRRAFEVLVIEYYSRESEALRQFVEQVDTWAVLDMPERCYYHKHLMYNAGIVLARGDILVFCDSDAMARPSLVETIVRSFDERPNLVLHLDQFRNVRRSFYPFNYPSFDDVLGPGCINNVGGQTKGVAAPEDPLHDRNYGACMCARREDLLAIGGADEHLDYLGHICGPYEMTFRLVNLGCEERWHPTEFLYHTWHPGQAGVGNYLGPHDGRHMSTTALEALVSKRTQPYVINHAIEALRHRNGHTPDEIETRVIAGDRAPAWVMNGESEPAAAGHASITRELVDYRGFRVRRDGPNHTASLIVEETLPPAMRSVVLTAPSTEAIQAEINRATSGTAGLAVLGGSGLMLALRGVVAARDMGARATHRLQGLPRGVVRAARRMTARTSDRWRRFFMERSHLSAALASIIVNLYFVKQARPSRDREIVLVLGSRVLGSYVRTLSAIGVLPPVRVVSLRSHQVASWLGEFSQNGHGQQLCIDRALYMKHYTSFAENGLVARTTVL